MICTHLSILVLVNISFALFAFSLFTFLVSNMCEVLYVVQGITKRRQSIHVAVTSDEVTCLGCITVWKVPPYSVGCILIFTLSLDLTGIEAWT